MNTSLLILVWLGDERMIPVGIWDEFFLPFTSPHNIIIPYSFSVVNINLFNVVKFYFLYKKILYISDKLPIVNKKKLCYTIGAKEVRSNETLRRDCTQRLVRVF